MVLMALSSDVNWTGDAWPRSHGIKEVTLQSDRGGFMGVRTYCGLSGRVDPALIHDRQPGNREVCESCKRSIVSRATT